MARMITDSISFKVSKLVRDDENDRDVISESEMEFIATFLDQLQESMPGAVVELDLGED